MSQRTRVILIAAVGTVASYFVFGGASRSTASGEPFDAVPRDSFLVATVNLAELRRSPLYEVLLGKESPTHAPRAEVPVLNARALGIGKLADACGFDPLSRVEQLAVAVPEEGDKGELGVAARVTVTREELSKCTSAMAKERGGKVETKDVGSFVVVEDGASQETARPRLAYGHGGLLVAGRGAWFDAMLEAADGKKPGVRDAAAHAAMRASLTGRDGWRSPTIVVTALLPRALRDRIKNEMGAEVGSKDNSANVMGGVLGVSSVGLALRAGGAGQTIDAAIELGCDGDDRGAASGPEKGGKGEEACAAVEKLILKKRLEWSKELMLRMVGLGPLLDSIDVKRDGARVRVTAGAPADALASTIDRVLRLKARQRDSQDEAPPMRQAPSPPPAPSAAPPTTSSGGSGGMNDAGAARLGEVIPAPRPPH
jgi:hypothetical protein